ncbi:MAG: hypothetical protein INF18_00890 [Methylobacterium sp.]|nr:hypothetical protein [Methylobacterium sp.]
MRIILAVLALASAIAAPRAHSFYPYECCSEVDCFPVPVPRTEIERAPDGWLLKKERITIPFEDARPSPDGQFHLCRDELGKGKLIRPHGKPPCLWAPEPGG